MLDSGTCILNNSKLRKYGHVYHLRLFRAFLWTYKAIIQVQSLLDPCCMVWLLDIYANAQIILHFSWRLNACHFNSRSLPITFHIYILARFTINFSLLLEWLQEIDGFKSFSTFNDRVDKACQLFVSNFNIFSAPFELASTLCASPIDIV